MLRISGDLVEWLSRHVGVSLDGEGCLVYLGISGNESVYYFRERSDGSVQVTCSDRNGPEFNVIELGSSDVVERYLYDFSGWDERSRLGLPRLRLPRVVELVAPGFLVDELEGKMRLLDVRGGTPVPVIRRDGVGGGTRAHVLVEFSYLLSLDSPEDIKASYCDPAGLPLASLFDPVAPPKTR